MHRGSEKRFLKVLGKIIRELALVLDLSAFTAIKLWNVYHKHVKHSVIALVLYTSSKRYWKKLMIVIRIILFVKLRIFELFHVVNNFKRFIKSEKGFSHD